MGKTLGLNAIFKSTMEAVGSPYQGRNNQSQGKTPLTYPSFL